MTGNLGKIGLLVVGALAAALVWVLAWQNVNQVRVSTGSSFTPDGEPEVVIVGDSYFAPLNGNPTPVAEMVADRMGWTDVTYYTVGGTGYVATGYDEGSEAAFPEYTDAIVAAEPDVVLIEGGGNDTRFGAEAVRDAAGPMLSTLAQSLPNTDIVVVGPLYSGANPDGEPIQAALEKAAKPVTYVDPTGWFPGEFYAEEGPGREYVSGDRVHPNEAGADLLADKTVEAMRKVGVPAGQDPAPVEPKPQPLSAAMRLLDQQNRPWSVAVVGDSTGNAPDEWVYLAFTELAEQTDRPLVIHDWSIESNTYETRTEVTDGANAPIEVWNGSASGMGTAYSNEYIDTLVPERVDLMILSHGHNMSDPDDTTTGLSQLIASQLGRTPPAVAVTAQNPRVDQNAELQESVVDAVRRFGQDGANLAVIDVYRAFEKAGPTNGLVLEDGFHPNPEGSAVWADEVLRVLTRN